MTMLMVLTAMIVAAGCGGSGKDIESVERCLKDMKLSVEKSPDTDKDVEDGVFATTDLAGIAAKGSDAKSDEFTFAMAAHVKDESKVGDFQKESKEFAKTASADGKLEFKTGTDGTYVWVAGGAKGSDAYRDALGCVEP
jgi:hypothetical protein